MIKENKCGEDVMKMDHIHTVDANVGSSIMEDIVEKPVQIIQQPHYWLYIQRNCKQYVKRHLYSSFYGRRFQNSENKQTKITIKFKCSLTDE